MSLYIAMTIMGLQNSAIEKIGRILDINPSLTKDLLFSPTSSDFSDDSFPLYPEKKPTQPDESFLNLVYEKEEAEIVIDGRNILDIGTGIRGKEWSNASLAQPRWVSYYTSPLRSHQSSCHHILGGNELLYVAPDDDEGFGIPIPYLFTNNEECPYTNYFGDRDGYNYNATESSTEIVDEIIKSTEILMGERQNLALSSMQLFEQSNQHDETINNDHEMEEQKIKFNVPNLHEEHDDLASENQVPTELQPALIKVQPSLTTS